MFLAAGFADAGIEAVLWIMFVVEGSEFGACVVEVADVVFGGVFGAATVKPGKQRLFDFCGINAGLEDVILVHDVAEEVAAIEFFVDFGVEFGGEFFKPFAFIARQGDVEGHEFADFVAHDAVVARGRACGSKAVQDGGFAFIGCAGMVAAVVFSEKLVEVGAGALNVVVGHFQDQVMLVTFAQGVEGFGQVRRQEVGGGLCEAVGKVVRQEAYAAREAVNTAFQTKKGGHAMGSKLADDEEGVTAMAMGNIVEVAVQVFAGDGQFRKFGEDVTTDGSEVRGVVGADVEDLFARGFGEGVDAYGENEVFASRAGSPIKAGRVIVVACGRRRVNVANDGFVVAGRATLVGTTVNVGKAAIFEIGEYFFGIFAKFDPQVIDKFEFALVIAPRVKRHFSIGWTALHECATGVVTDTADNRGTNTR